MIVDNDKCAFGALNFDAIIGSLATNDERARREPGLMMSSTCEKEPCGAEPVVHGISITFSAVIGAAKGIAFLATTIVASVLATGAGLFIMLLAR
jgi:hypothetical protein